MAKGKKTGGRQKGVPNKKTQSFRDAINSLGFDPAAELIALYKNEGTDNYTRLKLLDILLTYYQPKPKEQELDPPQEEPIDSLPQNEAELLTLIKPK